MLRLLEGNRRGTTRGSSGQKLVGRIGSNSGQAVLVGSSPIGIGLQVESCLDFPDAGRVLRLDLSSDTGSRLVDGEWLIESVRAAGDRETLSLIRSNLQELSEDLLADVHSYYGSFYFRTGHYDVFDMTKPEDAARTGALLAEIKSLGAPVALRVSLGEHEVQAYFDFTSDLHELATMDLRLESAALPVFTMAAGHLAGVEFSWLGCQYFLRMPVGQVDLGFGIVALSFPRFMVAVIARQSERIACTVSLEASAPTGWQRAVLAAVSRTGGELKIAAPLSFAVGDELVLRLGESPETIACCITRLTDEGIAVAFLRPSVDGMRLIFNEVAQQYCRLRSAPNYPDFAALYRAVGYGREHTASGQPWEQVSFAAWELQDSVLPGNTLGFPTTGPLEASISVIPISPVAACGHSIAMKRTAAAARGFLDLAQLNLTWSALVPGVTHYISSARLRSRFSTRLHVGFDLLPQPSSAAKMPALAVLEHLPESAGETESFTLNFVQADQIAAGMQASMAAFFQSLAGPHPLLADYHTVRTGVITCTTSGQRVAFAAHSSAEFFTAVDLYRCVVLFVEQPPAFSVNKLVPFVRRALAMPTYEVDLLCCDKSWYQPLCSPGNEELFYYQVHVDDFGVVASSISRSLFHVLRKYGEDALDYLHGEVRR